MLASPGGQYENLEHLLSSNEFYLATLLANRNFTFDFFKKRKIDGLFCVVLRRFQKKQRARYCLQLSDVKNQVGALTDHVLYHKAGSINGSNVLVG